MRLYEVGEHVQEGLSVARSSGRYDKPIISLGLDVDTSAWHAIELGNSIRRELRHPADREVPFRLKRGKFDPASHGLKLVAMQDQDPDDGTALVVIQRCELPGVPMNEVVSAKKHTDPEHLQCSRNTMSGYDTFLFRPGDGLFITWDARLTTSGYTLRFVIEWEWDVKANRHVLRQPSHENSTRVRSVASPALSLSL